MSGGAPQTATAICEAVEKRLSEHLMPRHPDLDVAFAQLSAAHDIVMALAQRCASAESAASALAEAYRTNGTPPGWAVEHGLAALRAQQDDRGSAPASGPENGVAGCR